LSKKTVIVKSGKRKTSVAKATLKEGTGKVKVNNVPISMYQPELYRLRVQEPLILSADTMDKVDISVVVNGGGPMSQADASRLAIGRALADYNPKLKNVFLNYDRQLLVADVRRKEASKPNRHGSARSKKQKSYR